MLTEQYLYIRSAFESRPSHAKLTSPPDPSFTFNHLGDRHPTAKIHRKGPLRLPVHLLGMGAGRDLERQGMKVEKEPQTQRVCVCALGGGRKWKRQIALMRRKYPKSFLIGPCY